MITLDWEKKDFFKNMCQNMIALLKADALPIVVWGDTTEELSLVPENLWFYIIPPYGG